jgi:hypothetical protein
MRDETRGKGLRTAWWRAAAARGGVCPDCLRVLRGAAVKADTAAPSPLAPLPQGERGVGGAAGGGAIRREAREGVGGDADEAAGQVVGEVGVGEASEWETRLVGEDREARAVGGRYRAASHRDHRPMGLSSGAGIWRWCQDMRRSAREAGNSARGGVRGRAKPLPARGRRGMLWSKRVHPAFTRRVRRACGGPRVGGAKSNCGDATRRPS